MFEDGVWRTVAGRRIFIKNGQSLTDAMKNSGKFKKNNLQAKLKKQFSEKEQISVSRAKQRFKQNISKYGIESSFEDSVLFYNLQKEEIKSLYNYAKKLPEYENKMNKFAIDRVYEQYKDGIK